VGEATQGREGLGDAALQSAKVTRVSAPDKKSFLLRIDTAVWQELERLAAADLRSVNAEIEFLLREALAKRGIQPREFRKKK
jgi:hypothetical protein